MSVSTQSGVRLELAPTNLESWAQSSAKPKIERAKLPSWWRRTFERQGGDAPAKFAHLTALLHADGGLSVRTLLSVMALALALAFRPHHRRDRLLMMAQMRASGLRHGIERVRAALLDGHLGSSGSGGGADGQLAEEGDQEAEAEAEQERHRLLSLLDLYDSNEAAEIQLDDEHFGALPTSSGGARRKYSVEEVLPRLHRACYSLVRPSQHELLHLCHTLASKSEQATLESFQRLAEESIRTVMDEVSAPTSE